MIGIYVQRGRMIHSCIFHRLQTTAPGTKNLCHQDNFSCFLFIKNVNACVCVLLLCFCFFTFYVHIHTSSCIIFV